MVKKLERSFGRPAVGLKLSYRSKPSTGVRCGARDRTSGLRLVNHQRSKTYRGRAFCGTCHRLVVASNFTKAGFAPAHREVAAAVKAETIDTIDPQCNSHYSDEQVRDRRSSLNPSSFALLLEVIVRPFRWFAAVMGRPRSYETFGSNNRVHPYSPPPFCFWPRENLGSSAIRQVN